MKLLEIYCDFVLNIFLYFFIFIIMEEDNLKKLTELGDAIFYLKSDLLSINTYEEFLILANENNN